MNELIDEMKNLEKKYYSNEIHRKSFQLYLPGISEESEKKLKASIPYLPSSYLELVKKYNFLEVCIGWFLVWPGGRFKTLEDSVIDALNDSFFPKEFMEKHKMYQVGFCNTDLICVTAGTNQFAKGEVLFVDEGFDIYNPQDSQVHSLAKDFEQFLIIAGNLNQAQRGIHEDESNYEEKKQEFLDRLKRLGVDEKYHGIWVSLF